MAAASCVLTLVAQSQGGAVRALTHFSLTGRVENALVAYAKQQETRKSLSEAVVNNRKAVELAMMLYLAGKSDFLNVIVAQRSLFTTEDALSQSIRTVDTNLIALYNALGGGWENTPTLTSAKPPANIILPVKTSEP